MTGVGYARPAPFLLFSPLKIFDQPASAMDFCFTIIKVSFRIPWQFRQKHTNPQPNSHGFSCRHRVFVQTKKKLRNSTNTSKSNFVQFFRRSGDYCHEFLFVSGPPKKMALESGRQFETWPFFGEEKPMVE